MKHSIKTIGTIKDASQAFSLSLQIAEILYWISQSEIGLFCKLNLADNGVFKYS